MEISSPLLSWYDLNRRTLPWRGSHDPYLIWISEIIFQQTRIEQGTGYYLRFVERFPTLVSLAAAGEDEVLWLWQGLGYYSRARNLLFTARMIMDQGGEFPADFGAILKLRGIGDYTASCIASICFGQPHAAVDGNVYRVLSRLFADGIPIDGPTGKKHFKQLAQKLISTERPGDFNEAMMDLGATVCKPRAPLCTTCPLKNFCKSFDAGNPTDFPVKSPAMKRSGSVMNYLLFRSDDQVGIRKRSGNGIWKGLYELPMLPGELDPMGLIAECRETYGIQVDRLTEIRRTRHILTHTELDIRFYAAESSHPDGQPENKLLMIPVNRITEYPFPKPLVDFLDSLGNE